MTGRTERQYRRRAHYPARINFGITNELRAAQRTKGRRIVNRRRRTREQLDTLDEQLVEVHAGG